MEIKKTPKADLENKRTIFLEIGFIVALGFVLLLFSWRVDNCNPEGFQTISDIEEPDEEIIPITRMIKPCPPPPPPVPKLSEVLLIVDDDFEIEDELEIQDIEISENSDTRVTELYPDTSEDGVYDEDYVFIAVQNMPYFPGGYEALLNWLSKNIRYPEIAKENYITGKVFVSFVINIDGSVCDIKIVRGVDESLDLEAIRVCSKMPKWKPGNQRGKPVRVRFSIPINFQIR